MASDETLEKKFSLEEWFSPETGGGGSCGCPILGVW